MARSGDHVWSFGVVQDIVVGTAKASDGTTGLELGGENSHSSSQVVNVAVPVESDSEFQSASLVERGMRRSHHS
jgi:hypothetical protein